ncbi:Ssp2 protein [Saccharomycopsis crataegensis]|uniref:Ssp2 protein n=1 Tax=Saccharomycopsis crataegensis TaxID=43959 RepID=A0AAV5QS10_9ASCO|nr:Ssp2 protein [Saccharomycopsis crataegensis]
MLTQITVLEGENQSAPQNCGTQENKKNSALGTIGAKARPSSGHSRKASLNNFWIPRETNVVKVTKPEKLGIRKLAKAYTRSLVSGWSTEIAPQGSLPKCKSLEDAVVNEFLSGREVKSLRIDDSKIEASKAFPKLPNIDQRMLAEEQNSIGSRNINLSNRDKKPLEDNKNIVNISQTLETLFPGNFAKKAIQVDPGREMILTGFPKNVNVNSILGFIAGGVIERIVPEIVKEGKDIVVNNLYLCFTKAKDAEDFFNFSKTGLFVVCGENIKVRWTGSCKYRYCNEIPKINELSSSFIESEVNIGACRCLIIKKLTNRCQKSKQRSAYYRNYGISRPYCDDFDIKEVEKDFSQYGEIVEITPAISRKLCVSIHYYDIRSAILAKKEKETTTSKLHAKYSDWAIWYGKDPADKPCIAL